MCGRCRRCHVGLAAVIQFGCGSTFYREVSVGDKDKFGMTVLVLFGTSAAYVSSVAIFVNSHRPVLDIDTIAFAIWLRAGSVRNVLPLVSLLCALYFFGVFVLTYFVAIFFFPAQIFF